MKDFADYLSKNDPESIAFWLRKSLSDYLDANSDVERQVALSPVPFERDVPVTNLIAAEVDAQRLGSVEVYREALRRTLSLSPDFTTARERELSALLLRLAALHPIISPKPIARALFQSMNTLEVDAQNARMLAASFAQFLYMHRTERACIATMQNLRTHRQWSRHCVGAYVSMMAEVDPSTWEQSLVEVKEELSFYHSRKTLHLTLAPMVRNVGLIEIIAGFRRILRKNDPSIVEQEDSDWLFDILLFGECAVLRRTELPEVALTAIYHEETLPLLHDAPQASNIKSRTEHYEFEERFIQMMDRRWIHHMPPTLEPIAPRPIIGDTNPAVTRDDELAGVLKQLGKFWHDNFSEQRYTGSQDHAMPAT